MKWTTLQALYVVNKFTVNFSKDAETFWPQSVYGKCYQMFNKKMKSVVHNYVIEMVAGKTSQHVMTYCNPNTIFCKEHYKKSKFTKGYHKHSLCQNLNTIIKLIPAL